MTKEDYVWVGIRIFGIYLLILALITLPSLVNSIYMSYQLRDRTSGIRYYIDGTEENVEKLTNILNRLLDTGFRTQVGHTITYSIRVVIFVLAGLYMTCKGKFLFHIVSSPLKKEDVEET